MQENQDKELYMYLKTVFKNNLLRTYLSTYIVQIPYNISIYITRSFIVKILVCSKI